MSKKKNVIRQLENLMNSEFVRGIIDKNLAAAKEVVDEDGFFSLEGDDSATDNIDPKLDQKTRIKLAIENFQNTLEKPSVKIDTHLDF